MRSLLSTDWHLDDQSQNQYRWDVFEHVLTAAIQYDVDTFFMLGDLVDRKDRFSSAFVNRLLAQLQMLAGRLRVVILRGNHDTTLRPPNYFELLNHLAFENAVEYVSDPTDYGAGLLLLPFSPSPKTEWSGIRLSSYEAVFMHATVPGAVVENGQVMDIPNFPMLPGRVKFYSGDIHVPQKVRNVTYVGAPHPIRFGDSYPCRMLLLDDSYDISVEIPLVGPRKLVGAISSLAELDDLATRPGDQVKIRCSLSSGDLDGWHMDESKIAEWARARGVTVASVEVVLESSFDVESVNPDASPETMLRQFADHEGLNGDVLGVGLSLLGELR